MFALTPRAKRKLAKSCNSAVAIVSSVSIMMSSVTQAYAQALLIGDPSAPGTGFLQTSNGTPQINIATPQGGVSVNKFTEFNVGADGLVLNNSTTGGVSVIGQNVTANPNLVSGPANTIVNEVTSASPSSLRGTTEVFGQKADVIIANPNGISCNGCAFLNSSSSILTTGTPFVNGSEVELLVTKGTVTIGTDGFSAGEQAGVFGRHVILNGEVATDGQGANNTLVISGGTQRVESLDFDILTNSMIVAEPSTVAKTSPFSVDSNQNGKLTSGDVRVIGSEAGLGVNLYGEVNANTLDAQSAGDLFYGDVTVTDNASLTGDAVRQYGDLATGGNVYIYGDSFTLYDGRTLVTSASGNEDGVQQGYIDIIADEFAVIAGEVEGGEIRVSVHNGSVTNNGFLLADGELTVFAGENFKQQRQIATEYDVYRDPALQNYLNAYYEKLLNGGAEADLAAEMLSRASAHEIIAQYIDKGASSSGTDVSVTTGKYVEISTEDDSEDPEYEIVGGDIVNKGGSIAATNNVVLSSANDVINTYVSLKSQLDATDGCPAKDCGYRTDFHSGEILAGNNLDVDAQANIENRASDIAAANNVTLKAGGAVKNTLQSSSYSAGSGRNNIRSPARILTLYGDVDIDAEGAFISESSVISAGRNITIDATGNVRFSSDEDSVATSTLTGRSITVISDENLSVNGGRFLASSDLDLSAFGGTIRVNSDEGQLDNSEGVDLVELTGDLAGQIFRPADFDEDAADNNQAELDRNSSDFASLLHGNNLLTAVETLRRADTGADIKDAVRSVGVQSFVSLIDGEKLETLKTEANAAINEVQARYDTEVGALYDTISDFRTDTHNELAAISDLLTAPDEDVAAAMQPELDDVQALYDADVAEARSIYVNKVAAIKAQHDPYITDWWRINSPAVYTQHRNLKSTKIANQRGARTNRLNNAETRRQIQDTSVRISYADEGLQDRITALETNFETQMADYEAEKTSLFSDTEIQTAAALEKVQMVFDEEVLQAELRASFIKKNSVDAGAPTLAAALTNQEFGALSTRQAEVERLEKHYAVVTHQQHGLLLKRIDQIKRKHAPYLTAAVRAANPSGYSNHQKARAREIDEAQADYVETIGVVQQAQGIKIARKGALQANVDGIVGHKNIADISDASLDQIRTDRDSRIASRLQNYQTRAANIAKAHAPYLTAAMQINSPYAYVTHSNYKTNSTADAHANYLGEKQAIEKDFYIREARQWDRLASVAQDSIAPVALISDDKAVQDAFVAAVAWRMTSRQATTQAPGKLKNTLFADDDLKLTAFEDISLRDTAFQANKKLFLVSFGDVNLTRTVFNATDVNVTAVEDVTAKGIFVSSDKDTSIVAGGKAEIGSLGNISTHITGSQITDAGLDTFFAGAHSLVNPFSTVRVISQRESIVNVGQDLFVTAKPNELLTAQNGAASARNDIVLRGSTFNVGRNAVLTADDNVTIDAAPEITELRYKGPRFSTFDELDFYSLRPKLTRITTGGRFEAWAKNNILLEGTKITVNTGNEIDADSNEEIAALSVKALNNVTLSAIQRVTDVEGRASNSGTFSNSFYLGARTTVTNHGTVLTAAGDLDIKAEKGDLTTAGSRFVSRQGDIKLEATAGDILAGTYTDVDVIRSERKSSALFGLINSISDYTLDTRIATGTKALANVDLSVVSGADTTLVGATLSAGHDLKLDVGGDLKVEAAISSRREEFFESKMGAVFSTTVTEESFKETATYTIFQAGNDLNITVGGKTIATVYDYAGEPNPKIEDLYPKELLELSKLVIFNETLADEYFYDETKTLSPAFTAVLTIAVTVGFTTFLTGTLATTAGGSVATTTAGLASTTAGKAGLVGFNAFGKVALTPLGTAVVGAATTSTVGILNGTVSGDLDLGDILKDAVFAAGTSYLTTSINLAGTGSSTSDAANAKKILLSGNTWADKFTKSIFGKFGGGNLSVKYIAEGALDNAINAGLSSAAYGTDFEKNFSKSFVKNIVALGLADAQFEIGSATNEGTISNILLHGAAGCAAAELTGANCGAGAAGGIVQAIYAGTDPGARLSVEQMAQRTELIGAVVGYFLSKGDAENVYVTSSTALSGILNNYYGHYDESGQLDDQITEGLVDAEAKWKEANCSGISTSECSAQYADHQRQQISLFPVLGLTVAGGRCLLEGNDNACSELAFSIVTDAAAGGVLRIGHIAIKKGSGWVATKIDNLAPNTATIGGKTCVYSCVVDGTTRYVGITDDIKTRGQAHLREKGIVIDKIDGLENLSRADARAVEQTLINYHGLGKNGGTLINKINSISATKNPTAYEQSLLRGAEILKQNKYPGF